MRKILVGLAVFFMVSVCFVPLASAADDFVVYSDTGSPVEYDRLDALQPSAGVASSSVARAFNVGTGLAGYLTQVNFLLSKTGSPTANFVARLYNCTTSTTAGEIGVLLATSITLWNGEVISNDVYSYPFLFNSTVQLVEGWRYFVAVEAVNGTVDSSNYVSVMCRGGASISGKTCAAYNMAAWSYSISRVNCIVYANVDPVYHLTSEATPTPPAPTGSGGSSDASSAEYWTAKLLPILVPLLVCLIPALIGLKFLGGLGFFVGLNIGVILAYVTLGNEIMPLWGVLLVGIADVLVTFNYIRSG